MNNVPESTIKRNEFGLLENIDYVFNEDNTINWKKMIPPEFLIVNPDMKARDRIEKKYGKSYNDIKPIEDNVNDSDLIQLLGASKYLLRVYGYDYVKYSIKEANENYAAVSCEICFQGNYLTQNKPIIFSDNACASLNSTNGFGQKYLIEMATNRAFVRCVRNFLNIGIISREEISGNDSSEAPVPAVASQKMIKMLEDLMRAKNVSWNIIAEKLKKENVWDDSYRGISDLPKDIIFDYINRLKKITV